MPGRATGPRSAAGAAITTETFPARCAPPRAASSPRTDPEGFTLREAARDVGVSHAAAYRHFADKRALLAAVCEEGYHQLARTLRAATRRPPTDDVTQRIERLATTFVRFALDDPPRFHLMFGPRLNLDGRFPSLDAATDETLAVVVAEIARGVASGQLQAARPIDLAIGFWTMLASVADGRLDPTPVHTGICPWEDARG